MNNNIPNRANAQEVLHGAFDMNLHKITFIHYFEVVISPEGVVEYAVPSHTEKLLQLYMKKYSVPDKDMAIDQLEEKCGIFSGYIEALCETTGYISVWETHYIAGCKPTQKQLNKLRMLKMNGLYHGRVDDIFTERINKMAEALHTIETIRELKRDLPKQFSENS